MLCIRMLDIRCSLADLQQFFTGKLYVLMYQLKLPAEELLWLAIPCTEDTSTRPPRSDMKITRLKIQALTIIHIFKKKQDSHSGSENPVTYAARSCDWIHTVTPAVSCNNNIASWKSSVTQG